MPNEYYDHTTYPVTRSSNSSALARAEFDSVEAGFDKLPTMASNGLKAVSVNSAGTALEAVAAGTMLRRLGAFFGQCQLTKVSTNLVLSPYNGNRLAFPSASTDATVPNGGVSLAPTSLTPGTLYYIYATQSGGVVDALEASTTTPAADSTTGIMIKSTDSARVLVGMAEPISGPAWADSATQRLVRSWFNDPGVSGFAALNSDTILGYVPFGELSATHTRCAALLWANESVRVDATISAYEPDSGTPTFSVGIGADSTSSPSGIRGKCIAGVDEHATAGAHWAGSLSRGSHYFTLLTGVSGGTNPTLVADFTGLSFVTAGTP